MAVTDHRRCTMTETNPLRDRAIRMMRDVAAKRRENPVTLATGEETSVYLDVKGVLTRRWEMNLAADAMNEHLRQFRFNAVGGPTMGADVLTHVMIARAWWDEGLEWFSVRDRRKTDHGLGLWIEGKRLGAGDRVVITDDVASSGVSLGEAYTRVLETGATVVAIAPFVDRAGKASDWLNVLGCNASYSPLMTYEDLGIEALGLDPIAEPVGADDSIGGVVLAW